MERAPCQACGAKIYHFANHCRECGEQDPFASRPAASPASPAPLDDSKDYVTIVRNPTGIRIHDQFMKAREEEWWSRSGPRNPQFDKAAKWLPVFGARFLFIGLSVLAVALTAGAVYRPADHIFIRALIVFFFGWGPFLAIWFGSERSLARTFRKWGSTRAEFEAFFSGTMWVSLFLFLGLSILSEIFPAFVLNMWRLIFGGDGIFSGNVRWWR